MSARLPLAMRNSLFVLLFGAAVGTPPSQSYIWAPRTLSCEHYEGTYTRCVLKIPGQVEQNPGCYEDINEFTNVTKVYCSLGCEESDETTIAKKSPQYRHECNMFYTYNLERKRQDWYLWRSGVCLNATIDFEVLCGTSTNPKDFYFNNGHLFEYEDAK